MENLLYSGGILNISMVIVSLAFLVFTVHQIKRGKLLLRYSLMWMLLSLLILILAIFPLPVFAFSRLIGFYVSANFIFTAAIFFLLILGLSQSRALSQQTIRSKSAIQQAALLEKRLEDLLNKANQ